ncbi:MAG TPA: hypothetical protein VGG01_11585 [Xanthobacteraceae bacterium]|jgi:hypothetical protein
MNRSHLIFTAASVALIATTFGSANGQELNGRAPGPYYDRSIHQSAGDRDSRGLPKYYQRPSYGSYGSSYDAYDAYGYAYPNGGTIPQSAIDFQEQGSR